MQQYAKTLREKVFGLGDDAVERIRTEIRSGKEGAWLAYQILKDIGALVEPVVQPQPVVAGEQSEEDGIRRIAIALVDGGLRRQKFFGLPLPELDEAEQFKNIDD